MRRCDIQDTHIVILGGGPGGYEAALVAKRLGAEVTLIADGGVGGAAVLTDVVPSKTLIATAEWLTIAERAESLGISLPGGDEPADAARVDLTAVNTRVRELAQAQSDDIEERLLRYGVRVIHGRGRLDGQLTVVVDSDVDDTEQRITADIVLLATGASPRTLPDAVPDGERILTWTQVYGLTELPERLIVVGSGVTGAEFAGAYHTLGCDVVLVSSRDRVLPGEDPDAAELIDDVFRARGMTVMSRSRAASARRVGDGVEVTLASGEVISGSHVLMAVGSVPNTSGIGLEEAGIELTESGHIRIDKVSRTTVRGVYAAGDCTGLLPLASVAAMQGRVAVSHALGDVVQPIDLRQVASTVFTAPEIATVGASAARLAEKQTPYDVAKIPLDRNPRAKMLGMHGGFIKLFAHKETGVVLGGVVVAPRASEFIFPITLAVSQRLTVDQVALSFTIYPSLSGSIAEAARTLHYRPGG